MMRICSEGEPDAKDPDQPLPRVLRGRTLRLVPTLWGGHLQGRPIGEHLSDPSPCFPDGDGFVCSVS